MVCKEEICGWFKEARCSERIELICNLLQMCIPLELRFLGSCVEDLAKKDFVQLREFEIKANDHLHIQAVDPTDIFDNGTRSKLNLFMALMNSLNSVCAHVMYGILIQIGSHSGLLDPQLDSVIAEDIMLLFTMAANHPAFTFCERQQICQLFLSINRLFGKNRYQNKVSTSSCNDDSSTSSSSSRLSYESQGTEENPTTDTNLTKYQSVNTSNVTHVLWQTAPVCSTSDSSCTHRKAPVYVKDVLLKGGPPTHSSQGRTLYHIQVTWSDDDTTEVLKSTEEVQRFHNELLRLFPKDSGAHKLERVIPFLPQEKGNSYQESLKNYFRSLAATPSHIVQSDHVTVFFRPTSQSHSKPVSSLSQSHSKSVSSLSQSHSKSVSSLSQSHSKPVSSQSQPHSKSVSSQSQPHSKSVSCGKAKPTGSASNQATKHKSPHSSSAPQPSPLHTTEPSNCCASQQSALLSSITLATQANPTRSRVGFPVPCHSPPALSAGASPMNSPRISPSPVPRLCNSTSPRPAGGTIVSPRRNSPNLMSIDQWLKAVRLHKYIENLRHCSAWDELFKLGEEDLERAGLTTGARKKFMSEINKVREPSNGMVMVDIPATTSLASSPTSSPVLSPDLNESSLPQQVPQLPPAFLHQHPSSYPPTIFHNPNHHFPPSAPPPPPPHPYHAPFQLQQPGLLDTLDSSCSDRSTPPQSPSSEIMLVQNEAGVRQVSPAQSATCSEGDDDQDKESGISHTPGNSANRYVGGLRSKTNISLDRNGGSIIYNHMPLYQPSGSTGVDLQHQQHKASSGMLATPPPLPPPPHHMTHFRPTHPLIRSGYHPPFMQPGRSPPHLMMRTPHFLPANPPITNTGGVNATRDDTSPQPPVFNGSVSTHGDVVVALNMATNVSAVGMSSTETVASYKSPIGYPPPMHPRPVSLGVGHDQTGSAPLATVSHPVPVSMSLPTHKMDMSIASHQAVNVTSNNYYPISESPSTSMAPVPLTPSPGLGSGASPSPPSSLPSSTCSTCCPCPHASIAFSPANASWQAHPHHLYQSFMNSPALASQPNGLVSPTMPYQQHHNQHLANVAPPPPLTPFTIPNGFTHDVIFNNQTTNFVMQQQQRQGSGNQAGSGNSGGPSLLGQYPLTMPTAAATAHFPPPPQAASLLMGPPLQQPPVTMHSNTFTKPDKSLNCCNCGAVGHRKVECKEPTFDMITRSGHYHLNMAPKTEPE